MTKSSKLKWIIGGVLATALTIGGYQVGKEAYQIYNYLSAMPNADNEDPVFFDEILAGIVF